jgi:glycosyltransferase involved in cell wall biosynthesis
MKNICIIDSFSRKNFHEICNASMLVECLSIADKILYFLGLSAYKSLKSIVGDKDLSNVIFKIIPVVEKDSKIHKALRFFLSAIINCCLLLTSKKDAVILYNYNNIFSLPLVNFSNKILKRKIAIICHGEFEVFNQKKIQSHSVFWKLYNNTVKYFFKNKNVKIAEGIIFLVLGDNIKANIKIHIPNNIYEKIYSIDHSYMNKSFCTLNSMPKRNNESMIKIGMIGRIRKEKNIKDVILLARNLSPEISGGKVNFSIIGTAARLNTNELKSVGITIPEGNKILSREEYDNKITELDYVLFFYTKDMYQFTASGPLMDALFLEKPIIALRNNYFEYMFNKYGNFGILLDSIDEMADLIKELSKGKKLPVFDFKSIKDKLQPEKIALQLKVAFEEAGFYT